MKKNIIENSKLTVRGDFHQGDINYSLSPKELVFSNDPMDFFLSHYLERRYALKPRLSFWEAIKEPAYGDLTDEILDKGRIVFLGEAGSGKSTELKRICNELRERRQFRVAYYSLKNLDSGSHVPHFSLSESNAENIEGLVLLLDGLDEIDFWEAKQRIESLTQEYPKLKIIVTCRSNIYKAHLEGFRIYYLQRLDGKAIDKYLREVIPTSKTVFEDRLSSSGIKELIHIPFYLEKIIQYFKANNDTLPKDKNEIVEFFINEAVEVRTGQTEREEVIQSLERLGFVMECMAGNQVPLADLEKVIDENKREILFKSSLIDVTNEKLQFTHLIFQEYLAAKALKRITSFKMLKEVFGVAPRFEKLKPSWLNSISSLWSMLEVGHPLGKGLLTWMITNNVEYIFKFERDKIDDDVREEVVKIIWRKIRKEELFDVIIPELVPFIESNRSFLFLLDKLAHCDDQREKQIILELLDYFDLQYIVESGKSKFKDILWQNILQKEGVPGLIKYTSCKILIRCFGEVALKEVEDIFALFFDSEDVYERAIVYELIKKAGVQNKFMKKLLERVVYIEENFQSEKEDWLGREKLHMERCFEGIKSEEALVEYFNNYSHVFPEHFSPARKSYFKEMLGKTLELPLSGEGYDRVFDNIKEKLAEELFWARELPSSTMEGFINISGKRTDLLSFCLVSEKYCSPIIVSILLAMESIPMVIDRHLNSVFNDEWVNTLIAFLGRRDNSLMERFVQEINQATGSNFNVFTPSPEEPSPEEQKQKALANEKRLLFNKEYFIATVKSLFDWFGKDRLEKDEVFSNWEEQLLFNHEFPNFLRHFINDRFYLNLDKLLTYIDDKWEWLSVMEIFEWVRKNNYPNLSEEEQQYLRVWCDSHLKKNYNLDEAAYWNKIFYQFTFLYTFKGYPENVYLNAIGEGMPTYFGNVPVFDILIQDMGIPFEKVKIKVLDFLSNHSEDSIYLQKHLEFIEKNRIKESRPYLQRILRSHHQEESIKAQALKSYLSCEGDEVFLFTLLEGSSLSEFLEDQIIRHGLQKRDQLLQNVLLRKLSSHATPIRNRLKYAEYLLNFGNLSALRFLMSYAKENLKSPFISDDTYREAIPFENKLGINYLLKLFVIGIGEAFEKDPFNAIHVKVRQMIFHLAFCSNNIHYSYVDKRIWFWVRKNKILIKLPPQIRNWLKVPSKDAIRSIESFHGELKFSYYQSRKFSLEEAVELSKKVF